MKNTLLQKARKQKNDEFYTLYEDVEKELQHYTACLEGKVIFCNADNYKHSNFVKYFEDNFHRLKLNKLHALDLQGNHYTYNGTKSTLNKVEDGDFREVYSLSILKESDIVVTNPPFSLFRDFINIMHQNVKDFIVIGNYNAIKYKNIFPLYMSDFIYLGVSKPRYFVRPDGTLKDFGNITWYTTFNVAPDNPFLDLTVKYDPNRHIKYDNYNAINVDALKDIPNDYYDVMGVPITILSKLNKDQFQYIKKVSNGLINGKQKYDRIFIKRRR